MNCRKMCAFIATAFILLFTSCKKEDIVQPEEEPGICMQIRLLENEEEFVAKLMNLLDDTQKKNYETGYLIYPSRTFTFRYEIIKGELDKASIVFGLEGQIDGFIHGHYGGLYPNFSGSDIGAMYDIYVNENMHNYKTFVCGVVSATGDAYLLKIENLTKFIAFCRQYFLNANDFRRFENSYEAKQLSYFRSKGLVTSYEYALYEMLENSGLVLFKSGAPFKVWLKLVKNSAGNLEAIRCN